jgi:hypothetical protein
LVEGVALGRPLSNSGCEQARAIKAWSGKIAEKSVSKSSVGCRFLRRIRPLCRPVRIAIWRGWIRMEAPMARKPNYSFERQERERAAAKKAAEKAAMKAERKAEAAGEKAPPAED